MARIYLPTPRRTYLHPFADLVAVTVESIAHPDFRVSVRPPNHEGRLGLVLDSDTRHHAGEVKRLDGTETPAEICELVLGMMVRAYAADARQQLKFQGVPILGRGC